MLITQVFDIDNLSFGHIKTQVLEQSILEADFEPSHEPTNLSHCKKLP